VGEDRLKASRALKISKGQIEGIIKMIDDDRYCMDISNQILAAQALLKKANSHVLKRHLNHCIKNAYLNDIENEKMEEIIDLIEKLLNK
jgi:DNA-binding FrmR family transcriptional regulator